MDVGIGKAQRRAQNAQHIYVLLLLAGLCDDATSLPERILYCLGIALMYFYLFNLFRLLCHARYFPRYIQGMQHACHATVPSRCWDYERKRETARTVRRRDKAMDLSCNVPRLPRYPPEAWQVQIPKKVWIHTACTRCICDTRRP